MRQGEDSSYAYYGTFSVGNEASNYRLEVGMFDPLSPAGDSLSYHSGMQFSASDNDNDLSSSSNCAALYQAPFWFNSCNMTSPLSLPPLYTSWSSSSLDSITFKTRARRCEQGSGQSCEKCKSGFFLCSSVSGFLDCCNWVLSSCESAPHSGIF